jgi:hypothetical protein
MAKEAGDMSAKAAEDDTSPKDLSTMTPEQLNSLGIPNSGIPDFSAPAPLIDKGAATPSAPSGQKAAPEKPQQSASAGREQMFIGTLKQIDDHIDQQIYKREKARYG